MAPATEIAQKLLNFEIYGMIIIESISRITFDRKAILPISIFTFDSSIADNEYQPNPEEIAIFFMGDNEVKNEQKYPPKTVPIIVDRGNSQILKPNFFIFFKEEFEDPISIPTKKSSKDNPILIEISVYLRSVVCLKKIPNTIPKTKDIKILII